MPIAVYIAVGLNIALVQAIGRVTGFEVYNFDTIDGLIIGAIFSSRMMFARYPLIKFAVLPFETIMLLLYASNSACTLLIGPHEVVQE